MESTQIVAESNSVSSGRYGLEGRTKPDLRGPLYAGPDPPG
jgi:hypothetical protein